MKQYCFSLWAQIREAIQIGIVFSLSFVASTALSQTNHPVSALDSLPKHCLFSAKFDQKKTLKSLPVPLKSTGKMFFSCHAGLIWETQTPIQESLILTRSEYQFKQQAESPKSTRLEVLDSIESRFLSRLLIGLMSADKHYIEQTFNTSSFSTTEVSLTPKDSFIQKAIKEIQITHRFSPEKLSISIHHTDGTLVNIDTHHVTVLQDQDTHMQQCLDTGSPEQHCLALFDPAKMAILLNENSGN